MLERINNDVEHVPTDLEVGLEKCHQVLAIERIDPYAILQADETDSAHGVTYAIAESSMVFRNIKNKHTPFFVPSEGSRYIIIAEPYGPQCSFPFRGQHEFFIFPLQKSRFHHSVARTLHDISLSAGRYHSHFCHCTHDVGSNQRDTNNSCGSYRIEYQHPEVVSSSPRPALLFECSHMYLFWTTVSIKYITIWGKNTKDNTARKGGVALRPLRSPRGRRCFNSAR